MSNFTVQMGEEDYRLIGPNGEEGSLTPYDSRATLDIGTAIYTTLAKADDQDPPVYRIDSLRRMPSTVEDVLFQESGDENAGPQLVDLKAETEQ